MPGACISFGPRNQIFLTLKEISAIRYAAILLKEASCFRAGHLASGS